MDSNLWLFFDMLSQKLRKFINYDKTLKLLLNILFLGEGVAKKFSDKHLLLLDK